MQIYEILFVRNGFEESLKIFQTLSWEQQEVMGVSVYRFEVDSDLALLVYDLNLASPFSPQIFEHVKPHLSGLVVVAPQEVDEVEFSGKSWLSDLLEAKTDIPTVLALQVSEKDYRRLDRKIGEQGLHLGPAARLIYWHAGDEESMRNVWKTLWLHIGLPKEAETGEKME